MNIRLAKEHFLLLLCVAAALAAGALIGWCLVGFDDAQGEAAAEADAVGTPCMLPDTIVELRLSYDGCGHTTTYETCEAAWTGRTREQLAKACPNDRILEFSAERVILARRLPGNCSKHLQLRLREDARLCVYRADDKTSLPELLLTLPFEAELLTDAVHSELSEGVLFDSLDAINAYLESIES